jgi:hypothetical protein
VHKAWALWLKLKIWDNPSLLFSGLWFGVYLCLSPEKDKIVSWKKKEFEDLVSFGLYFVIVEVSSCISTM